MKRILLFAGLSMFSLFFCVNSVSQDVETSFEEFPIDTLQTTAKRFELGVKLGYSYIKNFTLNEKTTVYQSYNKGLQQGTNFGAYAAYHVSDRFKVKLAYAFRNSQNSELYRITNSSDSTELMNLSNNYSIHSFTSMLSYRYNLYRNRVFLSPGVGVGYVIFHDDGQRKYEYTQTNKGITFNAELGLEYYISNHIGFGFFYEFSAADLNTISISDSYNLAAPDTQFNFSDFNFRFIWLF